MPIKVSDASFQADVLDAKKPVLVDFWAEWCGPCRMIAPALDELSTELADKVTIAKLNIDENPHVPTKYGVRGIPTMMIFHQGQVAATKVGALPKSKIRVIESPDLTVLSPGSSGPSHFEVRDARIKAAAFC